MLRRLSLFSLCCGFIAVSANTLVAQKAEAHSTCSSAPCCTHPGAPTGTARAPAVTARAGSRATLAHALHASPADTITVQELVQRLKDPAQRDALIDALQAQRVHVDLSDVQCLAERAACQAKAATCKAQEALCQALSSANVAHCTALATAAVRDAQPAIASALKSLAVLGRSAHAAPHARSAHAAHQDPDDPDDARDEEDGDADEDMQEMDEGDEPATIWEAPDALEIEEAEELARAAGEMGEMGHMAELSELAELGNLAEVSAASPAPEAGDDPSLKERVRALERAAHEGQDWAPKKGDDQRSLEERVTELEHLLRERERGTARGRSPAAPAPRSGQGPAPLLPPGRYGVYGIAPGKTPGGMLWKSSPDGKWLIAPTPPVAPAPPGTPPPALLPKQPAPPGEPADEEPPTVIRIPRHGSGGYGIYSTTPRAQGDEHGSQGFDYFWATPEAQEKVQRSMERAQRSMERALREKERVLRKRESSPSHERQGAAAGVDAHRQVEQLMQEMRGQMEAMRAEMNRLRAELERMPRNESR
jgi:hypothetical protein